MKNRIVLYILSSLFLMISCEDDFLNRTPKSAVSEADYFKTAEHLKLYLNQFYPQFPKYSGWSFGPAGDDIGTDNMTGESYNVLFAGMRTVPNSGGGWYWGTVRRLNYFFENYKRVNAPWKSIKPFVGEAQFFKAYEYFNKLRIFGDVPWITKVLNTDSEELYHARDPRNVVADSIISLLDKAIENLPDDPKANRLNRGVALLFKSRVCLYEGTWEKYHAGTDFGVKGSDGSKYLRLAADAAETLIDEGHFELYSDGDPKTSYYTLFNKKDYSSVSEVMLWYGFDLNQGMSHNFQRLVCRGGWQIGLNKDLIDSYLCTDGKNISESVLYAGDNSLSDLLKNRDPRLLQTIWNPNEVMWYYNGDPKLVMEKPFICESGEARSVTGFMLKKGADPKDEVGIDKHNSCTTATIIFRYAEALLNFAEAKVELGEITKADLDKSINKLRDRVNMAHMTIDEACVKEIRRERRVELACEGFRFDDLMRWAQGDIMNGKRPLGMKIVPEDWKESDISKVIVNSEGYIDALQKNLPNGYAFDVNRDYLAPLPVEERVLNKNLTQNPGWKE